MGLLIKFWWNNARPVALPQSMFPAVLAVCLASKMPEFSIYLSVAAVFGVMLAHLCSNLLDDYFDYKVKDSAFRGDLERKGIRARITKCPYLISGETTLKKLFVVCSILGVAAITVGVFIFLYRDLTILYITLIAAALCFSYSGSPLKLSYRGLGEIVIGLMFGPLLMCGVYYAACGVLDWSILLVSVSVGLLVVNIVYSHSIMDYEPDKLCGKMTFAGLLNNKNAMLIALFFILFMAFSAVVVGIIFGFLALPYLLVLLTLPMAVSQFYLMQKFVKEPQRVFRPRFWMGPMGNWEGIKNAGIDWFMIRWLLARNLLSFFCLIIIVVAFVF
ncbi:MAG: prenyltransferase [Bacteroidales bacterium]|nr:prenyltransferase [Bacteroidales bacterium]